MIKSKEDRFWEKVNVLVEDECWEWLGAKVRGGYGQVNLGTRNIGAHRLSFWIHTGIDPKNLDVLHKCDNPSCVNPHHLFLGNDLINSRDRVKKNRQVIGEQHINAKLNKYQISIIRKMYKTGKYSMRKLAKIFSVGYTTINGIINKRTWSHV